MLDVQLRKGRARFTIRDRGGDTVPGGPAWALAPPEARRAFWEILARHARIRKDLELAAGLDARGEPIEPARVRIGRYRGMTGPGLMPDRELSRTRRLLDVAVAPDAVTFTWLGDWERIVSYHALGAAGTGRPVTDRRGNLVAFVGIRGATSGIVRDVVGLSEAGLALSVEAARAEWRSLFAPALPGPPPPPPAPAPRGGGIRLDILGRLRRLLGRDDRRDVA